MEDSKPKLSIIIPVLNKLAGLKATIDSINRQTFRDFEVWIIDGKSSEETQDYLRTLSAPFFYKTQIDSGIYEAMNTGILEAKGDWLYFLGAEDVFCTPDTLRNVFKRQLAGRANLISGRIVYEGSTIPFVYSKKKRVKYPSWSFAMWIRNGLHHQGTFYRSSLFLAVEYKLEYKTLADYELNLQLYQKKETCILLEEVIAKCNSDGISKVGSWELYLEEIALKLALSSPIFLPIFYILVFIKYMSKKIVTHE
ncbi:glycosyltransferase [uncultured Polaribacter sp.]|uniref:glycosyltransferase n=1 Tax=uncultured Polaribacter sp. TaxID=174711 RepID=UPI000AE65137